MNDLLRKWYFGDRQIMKYAIVYNINRTPICRDSGMKCTRLCPCVPADLGVTPPRHSLPLSAVAAARESKVVVPGCGRLHGLEKISFRRGCVTVGGAVGEDPSGLRGVPKVGGGGRDAGFITEMV